MKYLWFGMIAVALTVAEPAVAQVVLPVSAPALAKKKVLKVLKVHKLVRSRQFAPRLQLILGVGY